MNSPIVFVVDDDPGIRDSLALLLGLKGYRTECFASADDFLAACRTDQAGCLVLDLCMPGMTGLDLQRVLKERGISLPVIFVTAHGDVAATRTALRGGAMDFLEKPFDDVLLVDTIAEAIELDRRQRAASQAAAVTAERLSRLTGREREVLQLVVAGQNYREIAAALGISPRTVEVYRARMMEKMQTRSVTELVRLVLGCG